MVRTQEQPLTLRQYLILSLMAFRGEGVPYAAADLPEHLRLVGEWLQERESNDLRSMLVGLVLSGHLFVGVVEGKIVLRESGKPLDGPAADAEGSADRG